MIRIDDEEENRGVRRQFFPFGNIIVGRDARRPAEPSVHFFSTERGPGAAQNSKTRPTRRRSPPARQRLKQSGGAPPARSPLL